MNKSDKLEEGSTILDETLTPYFTDVYSPGETKQKLRLGKEVLGSAGGNVYVTTIQQVLSGTFTTTITTGFPISKVKVTMMDVSNPGSNSITLYTASNNTAIGTYTYYYYNGIYIVPQMGDINSTNSIGTLQKYNTSNRNRARIENITSTGFDFNMYQVEYTGYSTTIILECF